MNDEKLAELCREADHYSSIARRATEKASARKAKILAEMERRGAKGTETHGVRITYVKPEPLVLNRDLLKTRLPATVWRKLHKPVFDQNLLAEAVQEGIVDPGVVADCSAIDRDSTAYVRVTILET